MDSIVFLYHQRLWTYGKILDKIVRQGGVIEIRVFIIWGYNKVNKVEKLCGFLFQKHAQNMKGRVNSFSKSFY